MKHVGKIVSISIALLSLFISVTGCVFYSGTETPEWQRCEMTAYSGIPAVVQYKISGCNVRILEKDEYGRVLFSLNDEWHDFKGVTVMQGYDDESVFFYEDILYYTGAEDAGKTAALKEQNDWGKELDKSKMTKRYIFAKNGYDMFFYWFGKKNETVGIKNEAEIKNGIKKLFAAEDADVSLSEYDSNGLIIVFASVKQNDGNETEIIALCSDRISSEQTVSDESRILSYIEYGENTVPEESVPQMKRQYGWKYTYMQ